MWILTWRKTSFVNFLNFCSFFHQRILHVSLQFFSFFHYASMLILNYNFHRIFCFKIFQKFSADFQNTCKFFQILLSSIPKVRENSTIFSQNFCPEIFLAFAFKISEYISLLQKNNVTTAKIIIFQNECLKFSRHEKFPEE